MKQVYAILFAVILSSCKNQSSQLNKKMYDSADVDQSSNSANKEATNIDSMLNYIALNNKQNSKTFGNLVEVNQSDSAGPFLMKEFVSDSINFDLIFYPKNIPKKDVISSNFENNYGKNGYEDFNIFAFVYRVKPLGKFDDIHLDNTIYPAEVKCYEGKKGVWRYISTKTITDLPQLSKYKMEVIYSDLK